MSTWTERLGVFRALATPDGWRVPRPIYAARQQILPLARPSNELVAPHVAFICSRLLRGADAAVLHPPGSGFCRWGKVGERTLPGAPAPRSTNIVATSSRHDGLVRRPSPPRGRPAARRWRSYPHAGRPPRRGGCPPPMHCTPPGSASARLGWTGEARDAHRDPRLACGSTLTGDYKTPLTCLCPQIRGNSPSISMATPEEDQADRHADDRRGVAARPTTSPPSARSRSRRSPASRSSRSTPEDLPPDRGADRPPGRVSVHARRLSVDVPRPAVDDAAVRGLRHGGGDQRALPLPARPRPDGPEHGVRHAVADGPRLRPRRARSARSAARASRSTRSTTWRRCSPGSTSARSACR